MNTANAYHAETSHVRTQPMGRALNWGDQPIPFKIYKGVPTFHLTQDLSLPDIALGAVLDSRLPDPKLTMPDLLAGVCYLTAGLTRIRRQGDNKVFHFRAVPSAGALYPTELYVSLQNVNGMNDGLYHYSPLEHTLTPLRQGQVFSALAGGEPIIRFYLTSIFHRSAWKYGPRAYRYCLLDAGHMAENLLMAARTYGLPASVEYDFDDDFINDFLCVDSMFEGCVAQVNALGCTSDRAEYDTVPPIMDGLVEFSRCAKRPEPPSELIDVHRACSTSPSGPLPTVLPPDATATRLPDPKLPTSASGAVQKRTSSRNFITKEPHPGSLTDVLGLLCLKQMDNPWSSTLQVGFLANDNASSTPGYYHLDPRIRSTSLIHPGSFQRESAHICLDQQWLENAALHLTFSADLATLEAQTGPRTYRYAHLEAGRLGQRAYLAATANNLGACGIGAYFDQEAQAMLNLPEGNHLLYLVAVGPVKK